MEPFSEMDGLAAADEQSRNGQFQIIFRNFVARLLENRYDIIREGITPSVERGSAVAQHQARLPALAVILKTEIQPETP